MTGTPQTTDGLAHPAPAGWGTIVWSTMIAAFCTLYLSLFWVNVNPWMPRFLVKARREFQAEATALLRHVVELNPRHIEDARWIWAIVSVVMGILVPWIVMAACRRGSLRDIGLRRPNRVGWRLMAICYVGSLPFLLGMAVTPAMRAYYRAEILRSFNGRMAYIYLLVLLAEHFFFHGVLLAVLRPGRRWPDIPPSAPIEGPPWHKALRWVGLAMPTGGVGGLRSVTRWLGLPDACLYALILQALMFGLVHMGKAPAELAASFPGGLALGYVAYRCNSLVAPMLLHLATALTTLAMIRCL